MLNNEEAKKEAIKSCFNCVNYWQGTQGVNCCNFLFKPAFIAYSNLTDNHRLKECPQFDYKPIKPDLLPVY